MNGETIYTPTLAALLSQSLAFLDGRKRVHTVSVRCRTRQARAPQADPRQTTYSLPPVCGMLTMRSPAALLALCALLAVTESHAGDDSVDLSALPVMRLPLGDDRFVTAAKFEQGLLQRVNLKGMELINAAQPLRQSTGLSRRLLQNPPGGGGPGPGPGQPGGGPGPGPGFPGSGPGPGPDPPGGGPGPDRVVLEPFYDDYDYCDEIGDLESCDYYDYGVNIEGTGSMGILVNILLNQINQLSNLTPRLGARARADSAATGSQTASRRNTTVVVQNRPSRTAGLYLTGAVALDPSNAASLSAGTSTAVAKNIASVGFPVNNYASSGESFAIVNASSSARGNDAATRTLAGGLATAGNRAVATTTGTFAVGPVIGIFNAGNRAGAASQNGVFTQSVGTSSASYLQVDSLAVVSPGNPAIANNMQDQKDPMEDKPMKPDQSAPKMWRTGGPGGLDAPGGGGGPSNKFIGDAYGGEEGDYLIDDGPPGGGGRPGAGKRPFQEYEEEGKVPFQDYYYYNDQGSNPAQTNAAGGVSKAWMLHRNLVSAPSTRQFNTRAQLNTFGAANGFGWTRGVSQNEVVSSGTRSAGARLRAGAFGTGASTLTAGVGSVTDLQAIKCQNGRKDGRPDGVGTTLADCLQEDDPDFGPGPGNKPGDKGNQPGGAIQPKPKVGVDKGGPGYGGFRSGALKEPGDDEDLLTPELKATLAGNMFAVRRQQG